MTSPFAQELVQAEHLYHNSADNAQNYADLLIHLLHEYAHSEHSAQLFQMLMRHLTPTDTTSEHTLSALHQDCAFELFPALVTVFAADPVTLTAVFRAMSRYGRAREVLLLIQEQWSAHPHQYALNNELLTCTRTLLVRLGDKSATHLDAIARASVKLLCRVPADEHEEQEAPREEDQMLAVHTLNAAEQLRNNRTTRREDDSLKHIEHYLEHVTELLEHVTASCEPRLSTVVSNAIFRLLEQLLPYLETTNARTTLLILRTVPRVNEFMQLLQHSYDEYPLEIGGYLYLLYLRSGDLQLEIAHRPPLVYAPRRVFAASVPYMTALLSADSPRVRNCGVQLVTWCVHDHVVCADLELGDFTASHSDISTHPALQLAQAMVDFVVRCDDQKKRTTVFNSVNEYLQLFSDQAHYELLIALIAQCPYPHVSAVFIDQYRKLLPHVTAESPFMKHLVSNLQSWLTARDLTTGRDVLNAALSLTRVALLNRHVSQSAALHAHHAELLACVKRLDEQLVVEIRREMSNSTWESQRETAAMMARQGLAAVSARDLDVAQQQHIVQLQMIHSLVTRVAELLNEARD